MVYHDIACFVGTAHVPNCQYLAPAAIGSHHDAMNT